MLSTRTLLVCAAIGVATGIVGGIAGIITPFVVLTIPWAYGVVLGVHVLPGVIAQQVLRMPLVALLTHVMAALVSSAFAPIWMPRYLGTALLFGALQEGVAALTRYRAWGTWRFLVAGAVIGVVIAGVVFVAVDLHTLPVAAQIGYLALSVIAPVAWTAFGLWLGRSLRRAGVSSRGIPR